MSKPVESVEYTQDDGSKAFAIVVGKDENSQYDLAVLDPDTYQWHAANSVPPDRVS